MNDIFEHIFRGILHVALFDIILEIILTVIALIAGIFLIVRSRRGKTLPGRNWCDACDVRKCESGESRNEPCTRDRSDDDDGENTFRLRA